MRHKTMQAGLLGAAFLMATTTGCKQAEPPPPSKPVEATVAAPPPPPTVELPPTVKVFFAALPARFENPQNAITPEKTALGQMLYHDARLSKNHDISCNSCHKVDGFGVDGEKTSPGHKGQRGDRNSPTSFNAGAHVAQFWDGRAADLEAQAKGPILNPVEMAMPSEKKVVEVLKSIPGYADAFKKAFPADKDPITYDNMAKAIAVFERQLVTPGRFDKFLGGDDAALTLDEKKGLKLFVETGCTTCHLGAAVGGSMFQKLGLVKPWPDAKDEGRFKATKNEADKMMFRVPSLRNIEKTGPYFHDGSVATLSQAVKLMATHQLGKDLSDADTASIVTFLKALTGEVPAALAAKPTLPPSGPKTPKPDPK